MAKRTAKTTHKQYEIYVKYLEDCSFLRTGKTAPDKEHNNEIWKKLTLELNSTGVGPSRNVEAWKKNETGGGLGTEKFLTSLELQLISLLGLICIEGINVPEL
ncbi:proliferation disrupter, partial [Carabus blaptoides fortunei]